MTMTTAMTYTELFAVLVADLEITIKRRKNDASIRFGYGGAEYDVADRTERMELIERISDDYVKAHADVNQRAIDAWEERGGKGERPVSLTLNTALIDKLTDAVLDEELTDPDPYKMQHADYPILSKIQLARRREGRRGTDDSNMCGETTILEDGDDSSNLHARTGVYLASDGRDYRLPIRRTRTLRELMFVDENATIRNEARAAQYEHDIAPSKVVTYNLRDTGGVLTESFVMAAEQAKRRHELLIAGNGV